MGCQIPLVSFWLSLLRQFIIDREAGEMIRLVASVRLSVYPSADALTFENIIECSPHGAFKMVGHSKWLLFRQVAPLWSITLLIFSVLLDSDDYHGAMVMTWHFNYSVITSYLAALCFTSSLSTNLYPASQNNKSNLKPAALSWLNPRIKVKQSLSFPMSLWSPKQGQLTCVFCHQNILCFL